MAAELHLAHILYLGHHFVLADGGVVHPLVLLLDELEGAVARDADGPGGLAAAPPDVRARGTAAPLRRRRCHAAPLLGRLCGLRLGLLFLGLGRLLIVVVVVLLREGELLLVAVAYPLVVDPLVAAPVQLNVVDIVLEADVLVPVLRLLSAMRLSPRSPRGARRRRATAPWRSRRCSASCFRSPRGSRVFVLLDHMAKISISVIEGPGHMAMGCRRARWGGTGKGAEGGGGGGATN